MSRRNVKNVKPEMRRRAMRNAYRKCPEFKRNLQYRRAREAVVIKGALLFRLSAEEGRL